MDDRELLERAARAAGLDIDFTDALTFKDGPRTHLRYFDVTNYGEWWNPLHKDGDALRLAVKLNVEVYQSPNDGRLCAFAGYYVGTANTQRQRFMIEPHDSDSCAATRRAIVRAAASHDLKGEAK